MTRLVPRASFLRFAGLVLVAALAACSGPSKPVPKELVSNVGLIGIKKVWTAQVGAVESFSMPQVAGQQVLVASSSGTVTAFAAENGQTLWQVDVGSPVVSGVGSDGQTSAVLTESGDLVAMAASKVLWKQRMGALGLTAPLVAGARIFTLSADRTVTAFDAANGQRLWQLQRSTEPLVLGQAGVLMAVGDTLVVGVGGRLLGLNPMNGVSRWEVPIAVSRGTNEIERLVDLVAGVTRLQGNLCVRAFRSTVACVDATKGALVWSKSAVSASGLGGNEDYVFGAEADGQMIAWSRRTGDRIWTTDALGWRGLSTPVALGQNLVVGDSAGYLHFLSRIDGALVDRAATDGSPIVGAPLLVGKTLIAVTKKGGVFAFRPE